MHAYDLRLIISDEWRESLHVPQDGGGGPNTNLV